MVIDAYPVKTKRSAFIVNSFNFIKVMSPKTYLLVTFLQSCDQQF